MRSLESQYGVGVAGDILDWKAGVIRARDAGFRGGVPVDKDDLAPPVVAEVAVGLAGAGIEVIPFLEHGMFAGGGGLEGIDLGGVAEERGA